MFNRLMTRQSHVDPNNEGQVLLHAVSLGGNVAVLRALLGVLPGTDINPYDKSGRSPLHLAAQRGHVEMFRELMQLNGKMCPDHSGLLPIHLAAREGHGSIVELCPRADFEALTVDKRTPLCFAALCDSLELVNFLIKETGNTEAEAQDHTARRNAPKDKVFHISPLVNASRAGHEGVVQSLIKKGGDIWKTGENAQNLLHLAARAGNLELVKYFIEAGLDPLVTDDQGRTPLHAAAAQGSDTIVKCLIDNMRNSIGFRIDQRSHDGRTALMLATSFPVIDILLKNGADPRITDHVSASISHMVAPHLDSSSLEQWLGVTDADITAKDRYGYTILHYCASSKSKIDTDTAKLLIERGISVEAKSCLGETPVFIAALEGSTNYFYTLLDLGADPFQKDARNRSIEQYINPQHPTWDRFQSHKRKHNPPLIDEHPPPLLETCIENLFQTLERQAPLPPLEAWHDHQMFAFLFLDTKRDEVTRLFLEGTLTPLYDGKVRSELACSDCKNCFLERPMQYCRSCYDYRLCRDCFNRRKESKKPGGCPSEHEYLEYGGDDWWDLPEGVVNKEGQTREEWFEQMKADFRKEHGFTDAKGAKL